MTDVRTLRVTKVQESFKSDRVRFSGVPVNPETQTKTSAIDFYFIDTNSNTRRSRSQSPYEYL